MTTTDLCPDYTDPATEPMPLSEQLAVFDRMWPGAVVTLRELVTGEFLLEAVRLARERMVDGYHQYGDRTFRVDAQARRQDVLEEVADALVYLVSGEI